MTSTQSRTLSMLVDGEWAPAASGATAETVSPATGEVIGAVPQGDRSDAQRAIAAANRAFEGWSRMTAFERAAKMHAVGDVIERRRDELARTLTLDQGKPLASEAYDEVDELVEYWRMAAEDAKRLGGELPNSFSPNKRVLLVRRARGVVGVITPWNWPYTMPAELLAPALACGNTVGVDAGAHDVGVRGRARRVHGRGRPSARRRQPRHRPRRGGGGRDRPQPGHARGRVHRLHAHRADRSPRRPRARPWSSRWAATARWW